MEFTARASDPAVAEEHRARIAQADDHSDDGANYRNERSENGAQDQIERSFGQAVTESEPAAAIQETNPGPP